MKDVTISAAVAEVTLAADGSGQVTGSVTVSLTVGGDATERVVLAAVGAVPATIERPLRDVGAQQTEQFVATFDGSAAAPGRYPVKFVGYPSDEAPEEYADRGQVVQVVVPERPVPPARRPFPWLPVAAAAAALLAVVAVAVVLTRPDAVTVPAVVGRPEAAARAALSAAGLTPKVTTVVGRKPFGRVTAQRPAAGTEVAEGSEVIVTIPVGRRVEAVTGLTAAQASARLEVQGFVVTVVTEESDRPVGTVVAQSPAAGTAAAPGELVTITVAGIRFVEVPNVVGLDPKVAANRLLEAGLRPTGRSGCVGPLFWCVVRRQAPGAGERVPAGAAVTLVTGRGERSLRERP